MPPAPALDRRRGWALALGWRRVATTLAVAGALTLLHASTWTSSLTGLTVRVAGVALFAMLVFGLFEQWPRRLPRWLARWVLQVVAVAAAIPLAVLVIYLASTPPGRPPFWQEELRLTGFGFLSASGLLVGPWVALGALVRQREAFAREQALGFELERSELQRSALDARLRLLQAQVQPHFLFNTLANVRALVNAGSPRAPALLDSLIDYLRAAVPRLDERFTSVGDELALVRAYLDLMQLRMPDRLQFSLQADPAARGLRCPPLTVLTLVENAVRHGIDPAEEGGRIDVQVCLRDARCAVCVKDSGVGLRDGGTSLGTGLSALRERLALSFGSDARLTVGALEPHGVRADVEFPAQAHQA